MNRFCLFLILLQIGFSIQLSALKAANVSGVGSFEEAGISGWYHVKVMVRMEPVMVME